MSWLHKIFKRGGKQDDEHDSKLAHAEKRIAELERRSGTARQSIRERMDRNHWGETVKLIATGGHR